MFLEQHRCHSFPSLRQPVTTLVRKDTATVFQRHYAFYHSDIIYCGVTLLFEHSPSWANEIEHFEIFGHPRQNQLA